MTIELVHSDDVLALAKHTRRFVRERVIPVEREHWGRLHGLPEQVRVQLQAAAKDAGVFAPHVSPDYGGHGLDMRDRALVFEEAGYSLFGPLALNIAAPDEGNMHLLEVVATDSQKERFLAPLATGEVRSCFAMTEPAPGAGSDPNLLRTTASRVSGGWRIDGYKWFITGASGADFAICMARTSGEPGSPGGATMFLVPMDTPGVEVVREINSLDEAFIGGHGEVRFEGCVVEDSAILGEVDKGFDYAQVRLGPARLTHCMRWLGIARRAHHVALEWAGEREVFGSKLAAMGMTQQAIADSEIDLAASRALILDAAYALDTGERASQECSIAKTFVAEAVNRVVDRSLQICGALGVSDGVPLSRYLREVRPFRIYDGPSETHRWSIARRAVRRREQGNPVPGW